MRRRAIAGIRHRLAAETGQGLVMVLFTTMLLMALVVAATSIAAAHAVPSRHALDRAAALAAAQGGVQDFLAQISRAEADGACLDGGSCAWLTGAGAAGADTIGDGESSFEWSVVNGDSYTRDGFVRVKSIGYYHAGEANEQSRTLVADFSAGAELTDHVYYSTYETQSSRLIGEQNRARTIAVRDAAGYAYAGTPASDPIAWAGADAYDGDDFPRYEVCDRLWYDAESGEGRDALNASSSFKGAIVDWGETGTVGGAPVVRGGACEVMFSSASEMNGKVYSQDALLVSSSTVGGAGPTFRDTVSSTWGPDDRPAASPAKNYRAFELLPESTPSVGSEIPQHATTLISLPDWNPPTEATCEYTGPTRVLVEGDELVITSPMTPESEGDCYRSDPTVPGTTGPAVDSRPSVLEARVPLASSPVILVSDAEPEGPAVLAPQSDTAERTPDDSVLWSQSSVVDTAWEDDPATLPTQGLDRIVPVWTSDEAEYFQARGVNLDDLEERIEQALAAEGSGADEFHQLVGDALRAGFDGKQEGVFASSLFEYEGYRYSWTVAEGESGEGDATIEREDIVTVSREDALSAEYQKVSEKSRERTESATATVTLERFDCSLLGLGCALGAAGSLGEPTPQFDVHVERVVQQSGTSTVTVSAFPVAGDRTEYSKTDGDVYIEGELDGALSIVAENDIVVTGDLTHASGTIGADGGEEYPVFSSGDALALVAHDDVVVYHPVACRSGDTDAIAATTAGFCPDDVTGLYTGGIPSGDFERVHPSQQYVNLEASPVTRIDAAIVAHHGSLTLENHDKGDALGTLQLNGGVYQEHRGATGVEWEVTTGATARPRSGYELQYHYDVGLPDKEHRIHLPGGGTASVGSWTLIGTSEILRDGQS